MSQPTARYKRSFAGSVGSGMKSVMGGGNRRYYVLEHKVSSKYHRAGESQRIIVDQIELGRDPRCQVRFDETFATVSRRHAAIVKDGDNWKLVQLSHTNSTYLNGHKVEREWYLQSGDEIQLSTNGPKLGFIVPQGDKGLVKSIGMTARLNLFRQQALRPYKQAIAALACFLVLCAGAGGYVIYNQNKDITETKGVLADTQKDLEEAQAKLDSVSAVAASTIAELAETKINAREVEAGLKQKIAELGRQIESIPAAVTTDLPSALSAYSKDVYWIQVYKIDVSFNGQTKSLTDQGWIATGFLLDNGKFVTARHCVEGWRFPQGTEEAIASSIELCFLEDNGAKVTAYMRAYSNDGTVLELTSDQFTTSNATDITDSFSVRDENGQIQELSYKRAAMDGNDYAYVTVNRKGSFQAASSLSRQLKQGTKVYVLGYPHGLGAGADVADQQNLEPSFSESMVARSGITSNDRIQLSNRNYESGNSGGPVMVYEDGKFKVIGIVSSGMESIGFITPIFKVGN